MRPIRVLHVIDGLKSGGAETFIMNLYRNINREHVQFDFLIRNSENNIYINEIEKLGGRIFYLPPFPKRILSNIKELKKFLKSHKEYKIIHVHANSLVYIFPLFYAKKYNIPCRIIHSHNTTSSNMIAKICHYLFRPLVNRLVTNRFACSELAGKWMFNKKDFKIISNSIDGKKFSFNKSIREKYREKFELKDKFVVGHVGRFVPQKNHKFILKVFKKLYEKDKNSILLLIGDGPLMKDIKKEIDRINLNESIKLLGIRKDISELYQAMDVFLFPSLFEGLPFTLVEAQAAGLPCIISNTITNEVVFTEQVEVLSLNDSENVWLNSILKYIGFEKNINTNLLEEAGFDVKKNAIKLYDFYLKKDELDYE